MFPPSLHAFWFCCRIKYFSLSLSMLKNGMKYLGEWGVLGHCWVSGKWAYEIWVIIGSADGMSQQKDSI